jgi:uncharacterized protein (TIGR02996 family)
VPVYISIHDASGSARRVQISARLILIGSARDCAVVIDGDPAVAPRHLELTPLIDHVKVVRRQGDVLVDGMPVVTSMIVELRAWIQIGATTLQLCPEWDRHAPEGWSQAAPPHAWHERLAESPVEHELLAMIRRYPGDPATHSVYADWLVEHGYLVKADEVSGRAVDRTALLRESTSEWRALTSRAPIVDCNAHECPRTWDALAFTERDERTRSCGSCHRAVRFCSRPVEVRSCIARREPFVPDLALAGSLAYADRIDTVLCASIDGRGWTLERLADIGESSCDASWRIDTSEPGYFSDYTLVLKGSTLHLHHSDVRSDGLVELKLAGLDDDSITAWLRHAFDTLDPDEMLAGSPE